MKRRWRRLGTIAAAMDKGGFRAASASWYYGVGEDRGLSGGDASGAGGGAVGDPAGPGDRVDAGVAGLICSVRGRGGYSALGVVGRERAEQWHRIQRGEARVVVGTRSAVFAPG